MNYYSLKKYMRYFGALASLALTMCLPVSAGATTMTAPMLVSATVLSVCGVVATPLAFGNYTSTSGTALTATSTITATCSSGVNYTIALDAGLGTGGTVAQRVMTNTTHLLNYSVYTNSSYTTVWGDGTLSTQTQTGTSTLTPTTYTAYGRIPVSQQSTAGAYLDTITVSLSY